MGFRRGRQNKNKEYRDSLQGAHSICDCEVGLPTGLSLLRGEKSEEKNKPRVREFGVTD
jgi:hypothetical protein